MAPSLLTSLLSHITASVQQLQSELIREGLPEPWLDRPEFHPWDIDTPSQKYWQARRTLLSALGMMTSLVQNPKERLLCEGMGYHQPAALNFVSHTGIVDILSDPSVDENVGLPIEEITQQAGTHAGKTERILRFLCMYNIFRETSPSVFANNRLSITLQKGQPGSDVPIYWDDISFRAATAFSRTMRNPLTAHSTKLEDSPFCAVFGDIMENHPSCGNLIKQNSVENMKLVLGPREFIQASPGLHGRKLNGHKKSRKPTTAFEFLALPQCAQYRHAFAQGMVTLNEMNGPRGFLDFDWQRQEEKWDSPGSVFVEAGASMGHLSHIVLSNLKHAKFVNQDRPEVCEAGLHWFKQNAPEALSSGRVEFQPNDFLMGQPIKGAQVYILSNILHDWPDAEATTILQHIADAMHPASRLLVIEIVLRPCLSQSTYSADDSQARASMETLHSDDAPWPLLKDYGIIGAFPSSGRRTQPMAVAQDVARVHILIQILQLGISQSSPNPEISVNNGGEVGWELGWEF